MSVVTGRWAECLTSGIIFSTVVNWVTKVDGCWSRKTGVYV